MDNIVDQSRIFEGHMKTNVARGLYCLADWIFSFQLIVLQAEEMPGRTSSWYFVVVTKPSFSEYRWAQ